MLQNIDFTKILFLDIETVSEYAKYSDMNETMQYLWQLKAAQLQRNIQEDLRLSVEDLYEERAGIFAEFGKIVCISVGFITIEDGKKKLRKLGKKYKK